MIIMIAHIKTKAIILWRDTDGKNTREKITKM